MRESVKYKLPSKKRYSVKQLNKYNRFVICKLLGMKILNTSIPDTIVIYDSKIEVIRLEKIILVLLNGVRAILINTLRSILKMKNSLYIIGKMQIDPKIKVSPGKTQIS